MSKIDFPHKAKTSELPDGSEVRSDYVALAFGAANITDQNVDPGSIDTRHLSDASGAFKGVVSLIETSALSSGPELLVDTPVFPTPTLAVGCRIGSPILVMVRIPVQVFDITLYGGNLKAGVVLTVDGIDQCSADIGFGALPSYVTAAGAAYKERGTISMFWVFTSTATSHDLSVYAQGPGFSTNFDFTYDSSSLTAIVLDT